MRKMTIAMEIKTSVKDTTFQKRYYRNIQNSERDCIKDNIISTGPGMYKVRMETIQNN